MPGQLLHDLLTESARKYPENSAIECKGMSITYSDLEVQTNKLSHRLRGLGVKKGDRVGILLNKSVESIVSLFGILKTGAIYVPIDPISPAARAKYIIENCSIECLISSREHISKLAPEAGQALALKKALLLDENLETNYPPHPLEYIPWESIEAEQSDICEAEEISDAEPAYILHTSGSTGTPKGVVISHANALAFVDMAVEFFQIQRHDRIANHAPLHFDLSVFDIFCAVKSGATIVLVPELLSTFPVKLAEFIVSARITIWNSVSSVLAMLADRGRLERLSFSYLRLVHFSGDVLPVKYLRILKKLMSNADFYNIYGQTEANSSLFYRVNDLPDKDAWQIPIGKAFPRFDVFALDDENKLINSAGQEGELYIKSETVALGYWNDELRTKEKFVANPLASAPSTVYKTGDIVRIDGDGNYLFAGRKDRMVKSRGYRIELGEIEAALNNHPLIRQAAVIAVPDVVIGNRILAYVSMKDGRKTTTDELLSYCGNALPKYMIPESIEVCDELPITSNGKIDKKRLEGALL